MPVKTGAHDHECFRLELHSKIPLYNVFSVRERAFVPLSAPCGVRVRHPLVFSSTPKLHPLVFSVFFLIFFVAVGRIHDPEKATNKKKPPINVTYDGV